MNAVVTIAIGAEFQQMSVLTLPLLADYARRLGADLLSIHQPSVAPHFEKFRLYDLLLAYDRIIYLDTDMIVKTTCPDLLALVPEGVLGAWFPSRLGPGFEPLITVAQAALGDIGWRDEYFNTGVLVLSRNHRDVFAPPYNYSDGSFEQTLINYRVQQLKLATQDIGYLFNHTGRVSSPDGRFASHIIHYAFGGHIPGMGRVEQIRHDLQVLAGQRAG